MMYDNMKNEVKTNENMKYIQMGHSNYNSTSSLSDVSSFVTCDGVTFDDRRKLRILLCQQAIHTSRLRGT